MPLPGGGAAKLGDGYELAWTVLEMVKILEGARQ